MRFYLTSFDFKNVWMRVFRALVSIFYLVFSVVHCCFSCHSQCENNWFNCDVIFWHYNPCMYTGKKYDFFSLIRLTLMYSTQSNILCISIVKMLPSFTFIVSIFCKISLWNLLLAFTVCCTWTVYKMNNVHVHIQCVHCTHAIILFI